MTKNNMKNSDLLDYQNSEPRKEASLAESFSTKVLLLTGTLIEGITTTVAKNTSSTMESHQYHDEFLKSSDYQLSDARLKFMAFQ